MNSDETFHAEILLFDTSFAGNYPDQLNFDTASVYPQAVDLEPEVSNEQNRPILSMHSPTNSNPVLPRVAPCDSFVFDIQRPSASRSPETIESGSLLERPSSTGSTKRVRYVYSTNDK